MGPFQMRRARRRQSWRPYFSRNRLMVGQIRRHGESLETESHTTIRGISMILLHSAALHLDRLLPSIFSITTFTHFAMRRCTGLCSARQV